MERLKVSIQRIIRLLDFFAAVRKGLAEFYKTLFREDVDKTTDNTQDISHEIISKQS